MALCAIEPFARLRNSLGVAFAPCVMGLEMKDKDWANLWPSECSSPKDIPPQTHARRWQLPITVRKMFYGLKNMKSLATRCRFYSPCLPGSWWLLNTMDIEGLFQCTLSIAAPGASTARSNKRWLLPKVNIPFLWVILLIDFINKGKALFKHNFILLAEYKQMS